MADALKSKDGAFQIVPELAVEIAYMISNCEAWLHEHPGERMELGELLVRYLDGDEDEASVNAELKLWKREDEDDQPKEGA